MIWWNIFEFLVTLSAICFLITQDLRLFLEKKLIIVTHWYWTSHTITVNLKLCFLTHFSLSFTFLTYETFLTFANQQCFYPSQNTEGHKKGSTRTWITGFPAMETAWVACVLCFWSQYIFLNCFSLASIFHFAGKSKICTCNLRFHPSWCYRKIND